MPSYYVIGVRDLYTMSPIELVGTLVMFCTIEHIGADIIVLPMVRRVVLFVEGVMVCFASGWKVYR